MRKKREPSCLPRCMTPCISNVFPCTGKEGEGKNVALYLLVLEVSVTPYWLSSVTWSQEPGNSGFWFTVEVWAQSVILLHMLESGGDGSFRTKDHLSHTASLPDTLWERKQNRMWQTS